MDDGPQLLKALNVLMLKILVSLERRMAVTIVRVTAGLFSKVMAINAG